MTVKGLRVITPDGARELPISAGDVDRPLTELLRRRGLPLNTRCGGQGLCNGCSIELGKEPDATSPNQTVRACQLTPATLGGPMTFRIPPRSLLAHEPQVVDEFRIDIPRAHDPLWQGEMTGAIGAAIDIGTTTVATLLIDLVSGRPIGRAAGFNRQIDLADDVVSRISLCMNNPDALEELQCALVRDTIAPLMAQALADAGAAAEQVRTIAVTGNTTMLHLLAREDPTPLGTAPFKAQFLDHREITAGEVGLHLPGDPLLHLLPGAAAYVGADIVAGLLVTGLAWDPGPSILVDVGTNGEIVLAHDDRLFACATAAGPAFEGVGLSCGARAATGAVSAIRLRNRDVDLEVIGGRTPMGVCGSAYIDFLAEGRRTGLLTRHGRFTDPPPADLADRIVPAGREEVRGFRLGSRIMITEADVASLLQARAAIAAGLLTLLDRAGVEPTDIHVLHLAGGFGLHLRTESACTAGLLPGFEPGQIDAVGNTSLAGAAATLMDRGLLAEATRIAGRIEVVELNLDPAFAGHFVDQLALPPSERD